jgi:hypothetical protein
MPTPDPTVLKPLLTVRGSVSILPPKPVRTEPHTPGSGFPELAAKLEIQLVFNGFAAAKAALSWATHYARDLGARFMILAAQVVPCPLPLEKPPVDVRLLERDLGALAAAQPVETAIQIYLCRDAWETIRNGLPRESTVIASGRRRWWWPSTEQRFAGLLRRDGHRVMFLNLKAA